MMRLNLTGITADQSNCKSDHTPTPTRFIRNCEEVGLFQDLQNVNPFEEGFRKALNNAEKKLPLEFTNNDDTLHTPNILPAISNNLSNNPLIGSSSTKNVENLESSDDNSVFKLKIIENPSEKDNSRINIAKKRSETKQSLGDKELQTLICKERLEKRRESNRRAARKAYLYRNEKNAKNQQELVRLREENTKLKMNNEALVKEVMELRRQLSNPKESECEQYNSFRNSVLNESEKPVNAAKPRFILPKIAFGERGCSGNIICVNNSFILVNSSKSLCSDNTTCQNVGNS